LSLPFDFQSQQPPSKCGAYLWAMGWILAFMEESFFALDFSIMAGALMIFDIWEPQYRSLHAFMSALTTLLERCEITEPAMIAIAKLMFTMILMDTTFDINQYLFGLTPFVSLLGRTLLNMVRSQFKG
jgi:hypothetical protein